MTRILALAVAVGLLAGCDAYDSIRTWIEFDRDTEKFQVHARIENVSKTFFGCSDAEDCNRVIRRFLTGRGEAPIPQQILGLADRGAEDLKVGIEKDGDSLDVLIWYAAVPGSKAADVTGVTVERGGKLGGKLKTRMVVSHDAKRHVEGTPYERRVRYEPTDDGSGVEARQYWILHHKVSEVEVWEAPDKAVGAEPILHAVPGLADALGRGGLI